MLNTYWPTTPKDLQVEAEQRAAWTQTDVVILRGDTVLQICKVQITFTDVKPCSSVLSIDNF